MNEIDVAIIGAGLSGLTCARELHKRGIACAIWDKGRGVGGRMATRRITVGDETAVFDHGAQFFTARSESFQEQLHSWQSHLQARQWFSGQSKADLSGQIETSSDGHPRFCGASGMNSLCKDLAQKIESLVPIQLNARLTNCAWDGEKWTLHWTQNDVASTCTAQRLVLTSPVPQSLDLLAASAVELPADLRQQLEIMRYDRCVAAMIVLDNAGQVPAPGALYLEGEPIGWIGDNFQKGISPVPGSITLHAAPLWSETNYQMDDAQTVQVLADAARAFLGGEIRASSVARWKFSKPANPREDGCLVWREANCVFAGDAFGGAKVEGAWKSGLSAAEQFRSN